MIQHARRWSRPARAHDAFGRRPVNYVGYGYQNPDIRGFAYAHLSRAGIHIRGELPDWARRSREIV